MEDDLAVSTSRDILAAMSRGEGPTESLVALGYAGWDAGQLEEEMAQNACLSGPADPEIIFKAPPEQRWLRAAALMGVGLGDSVAVVTDGRSSGATRRSHVIVWFDGDTVTRIERPETLQKDKKKAG